MPAHGPPGIFIQSSLQVGKYLVSSLTRPLDSGRHAAAVSIRSGRGSMTHDRVLRFTPDFDTADQASCFAMAQALAWIDGATAFNSPQE